MKRLFILLVLLLPGAIDTMAQDNRIIADYKLEMVQDVLLSDHEIFLPRTLDINESGKIVFFDYTRFELIAYDLEDEAFKFFGSKGKGPREIAQVFDLKVDRNGEIYVIDTNNNKIITWDVQGEYIGEMSVGTRFIRPARFTLCKDSDIMYILSSQYSRKGLLHQYDKAGDLKQTFHKIEDQKARSVYHTDGSLACDAQENLYYAKKYVNEIIKYNKHGEHVYTIPVYDSEPNEEVIQIKGNWTSLNPSAHRYSGDIYYLNGKLYVSYLGLPKNYGYRYIDVYAESSQEYLYSIQLPYEFREFVITEDRIVILREDENEEMHLTVFNYEYDEQ